MRSQLLLLLVLAVVCANIHGRTTWESEEDGDSYSTDDDDWSVQDADDSVKLGYDIVHSLDLVHLLEEYSERSEYSLQGCGGGKCDICFKMWKLKGLLV